MKRATISLIMIMSLAAQSAFAQGTSTTKSKKPAPATYNYDPDTIQEPSPYLVDAFNIGFEYMSPNSAVSDIKNKTSGAVEKGFKNDLSTIPKELGMKMGYKQIARGGLGFDLNLSILKADHRVEDASDLTTIMPSANLIVAAPDYVYGAAGLNTAVVAGDSNAQHTPRIGYQVGAGLIVMKNFNFEIFYTWMNDGIEAQYTMTEQHLASTNARLIYAF